MAEKPDNNEELPIEKQITVVERLLKVVKGMNRGDCHEHNDYCCNSRFVVQITIGLAFTLVLSFGFYKGWSKYTSHMEGHTTEIIAHTKTVSDINKKISGLKEQLKNERNKTLDDNMKLAEEHILKELADAKTSIEKQMTKEHKTITTSLDKIKSDMPKLAKEATLKAAKTSIETEIKKSTKEIIEYHENEKIDGRP